MSLPNERKTMSNKNRARTRVLFDYANRRLPGVVLEVCEGGKLYILAADGSCRVMRHPCEVEVVT